jgi:hypothetical protein
MNSSLAGGVANEGMQSGCRVRRASKLSFDFRDFLEFLQFGYARPHPSQQIDA